MNYISIENVTKTYGDKVLFNEVTFHLNKEEKVALVAKNGTGKSTLLNILKGTESGDGEKAKVWINKDLRIGFLDQDPYFHPDYTVVDAIFDTDNPVLKCVQAYEIALATNNSAQIENLTSQMDDLKAWDTEAKVKEILSRFRIDTFDAKIKTLSGGQKKRLALAKILIEEPEMLILDEPTNHLDFEMIEWLEDYLSRSSLTLFMVTHDRYFLERVCTSILELEHGSLFKYSGSYSDYLEKKQLRTENSEIEHDKDLKLLKKELEWVRRMPQGRGTKAKSRVDSFHDLKGKTEGFQKSQDLKIELKSQRLGSKIIEAHQVSAAYGSKEIFAGFSYKFKKGERVGIIGNNGAGKSTLINILTQQTPPSSGKIVIGDTIVLGYYTQDGLKLREDRRVIETITDIAEFVPLANGKELTAASLLERFLFSRSQQQVYVSQLSGGERRRLYLLTILMQNPNFLILDEPTNDLDIVTLQVLEDFLENFPGCLIIVSHDRYFMDRLVDHLFVLEGDGSVQVFNGSYTQYRAAKANMPVSRIEKTQEKIEPEESIKASLSFDERKNLRRLEKDIEKINQKIKDIEALFAENSVDFNAISKVNAELESLKADLEVKEFDWLALAERE